MVRVQSPEIPDELPETAAVRCCSKDGKECVTPGFNVPMQRCSITSFSKAEKVCQAIGWRLCTATKLVVENKCCGTGCNFDSELTWFNNKTSKPIPPGEVTVSIFISRMSDRNFNSWTKARANKYFS